MTEAINGLQTSLSKILSGGLTYRGQKLKFEPINDEKKVYQAKTHIPDEKLAAGNSNSVFTFSVAELSGTLTKTIEPVSTEERAKIKARVEKKDNKASTADKEETKTQNQNQNQNQDWKKAVAAAEAKQQK